MAFTWTRAIANAIAPMALAMCALLPAAQAAKIPILARPTPNRRPARRNKPRKPRPSAKSGAGKAAAGKAAAGKGASPKQAAGRLVPKQAAGKAPPPSRPRARRPPPSMPPRPSSRPARPPRPGRQTRRRAQKGTPRPTPPARAARVARTTSPTNRGRGRRRRRGILGRHAAAGIVGARRSRRTALQHRLRAGPGNLHRAVRQEREWVRPIASISKLMTAVVVVDANQPMNEMLEITDDDIDGLKHTTSRLRVGG